MFPVQIEESCFTNCHSSQRSTRIFLLLLTPGIMESPMEMLQSISRKSSKSFVYVGVVSYNTTNASSIMVATLTKYMAR